MAKKSSSHHSAHAHDYSSVTSVVAKTDDGTIQITFSIPAEIIAHEEEHVLTEFQQTAKIPGFRPGKAPLSKVKENTDAGALLDHTLQHILPHAFNSAIEEHKLKPAIYPKFEILSDINDASQATWQIRAVTCELPDVELGDYKKIVTEAIGQKIIVSKDAKEPTREEKESKLLQALVEKIKVNIPKLLIEEEVNTRLSQLLEKIDKLGLSLEKYLASLGKDAQKLREEYETQAIQAISLELILNKIADEQKVEVSQKDIDDAATAAGVGSDQKRFIASVLRRRAVLDALINEK